MKSKFKKRVLAFLLCMVMVLSGSISVLAEENVNDEESVKASQNVNDISIKTKLDGTIITMSGAADSFPKGERYEIKVSELSQKETEVVEAALRKKVEKTKDCISSYQAYDICLFVDGVERQPLGNVNVTFEGGAVKEKVATAKSVDVYHIDEEKKIANDISGTVKGDKVEMTTDHFSTYVITTPSPEGFDVKIEHFVSGSNKKLFADSSLHLNNNGSIDLAAKEGNFEVVKVVEVNASGNEIEITGDSLITEDKNYRVYYQATVSDEPVIGEATFYDYQVNPTKGKSINDLSNYPSSSKENQRFAVGNNNVRKDGEKYVVTKQYPAVTFGQYFGPQKADINTWNSGRDKYIYKNIINGIDVATGALKMSNNSDGRQIYEPGLFTSEEKEGKQIYTNYKLKFSRTGNTYNLTAVNDGTEDVEDSMSEFFPLDDLKDKYPDSANDSVHNDYFGLRYDISFSLKDYIGDLNYSFTGDDDLWVVMDGDKVVVDVGGIHGAMSDEVDLWTVLLGKLSYTENDKMNYVKTHGKDEHRLTVLYMERGAGKSNCNMTYTLPNSTIISVNEVEPTELVFTKIDYESKAALAGAEFQLYEDAGLTKPATITNDKGETVSGKLTTGVDGKITLKNLKIGDEYYLKETKAPEGYIPSGKVYKITVTYKNGEAVAKLFDIADDKATAITTIPNTKLKLDYDKTVSVLDWNARTYKINLEASSKVTQSTTVTTPYDIILVLDASGSMENTFYTYTEYENVNLGGGDYYVKTPSGIYQRVRRNQETGKIYYTDTANNNKVINVDRSEVVLYTREVSTTTPDKNAALKTAAKGFVNTVKEKNPDSRIGVVTFAYGSEIKESSTGKQMLRVGDSLTTINSWIDNVGTGGATNARAGMQSALSIMQSDASRWATVSQTTGRKNMVVFLTDGVPTTGNKYDDEVAKGAKGYADQIESGYNADIYALGIFDYATNNGMITSKDNSTGGTIDQIDTYMKGVASSDDKYMTADSVESLYGLFDSITSSMAVTLKGTITDVIDSRFKLAEGQKEALEADGATVVINQDGTTTITWTDADIQAAKGDQPGWSKEIIIKAKDDFIGGNMIPTNGPASGIVVEDVTKPFPQPSVNVKLLTPEIGNKEITLYKGETIESSKFPGELLETFDVVELDGMTKLTPGTANIPKLTAEEIASLNNGGTISKNYSYPGTSDVVGHFEFSYKPTVTPGGNVVDHTATVVGEKVEIYELTVKYVPDTVANRDENLNEAIQIPNTDVAVGGTPVTDKTVTGQYIVNVLAQWGIIKRSSSDDSLTLEGAEFTLTNTDKSTTFWARSDSNGNMKWYKDSQFTDEISIGKIPEGTYTFEEQKAPAGYSKSNETWTIVISKKALQSVTSSTGESIEKSEMRSENDRVIESVTYYFENIPLYDLPSAGGSGIYWYMIGGTLLMLAAALILYKNRYKEVLRR